MLSFLSAPATVSKQKRVLFGGSGFIPGILLLQCWIERAWADGYDPEGCEQLGGPGSLMGSEKWIGATECAALLRQGRASLFIGQNPGGTFSCVSVAGSFTTSRHIALP